MQISCVEGLKGMLNNEQMQELGIEIIAGMKASAYDTTIEVGRELAYEETEAPPDASIKHQQYCKAMKKRLIEQALFIAKITLEKFKKLSGRKK